MDPSAPPSDHVLQDTMAAHHHQTDGPRVVAVDAMPDNLAYLRTSIAANEFPGDLVALVNAALR